MYWLCLTSLVCAAIPAGLACWNLMLYREPERVVPGTSISACTVIIPARNEEASIAACVRSVLASSGVAVQCLVMNDSSNDATAEICEQIAAHDTRLQIITVPALPRGWNGKQHACWVGAQLATSSTLLFLDADVRLSSDAIARSLSAMRRRGNALLSGIPREETGTALEQLLLPLIHFVLLGFLPMFGLRRSCSPAFAAGCGQFLLVNRKAYFDSGGHSQIKTTMHDGLKLPRVLRKAGFATDLADLTSLAVCRMYRSSTQVWNGLAKNATEGLAAPATILPFTLLLTVGQVLPGILWIASSGESQRRLATAALALAYATRALCALRFRQSWLGVALHPVSVALLIALQWWALLRKLAGKQPVWKQRAYSAG